MPIIDTDINTGLQPHYLNKLIELDAEETPALSLLPKGAPLKNPIAQVPHDDKETASKSGVKDGTDAPADTKTDNYRILKSWNHMLEESIKVGKKAENLNDQAGIGIKGQYKRQLEKKMRAMKTAADQIICDGEDMVAEGAAGSETRGMLSWCSNNAQGVEPVDALYRTPVEQISVVPVADFTEETFQGLVNGHNDNTGRVGKFTALSGIAFKQKVSNWSIHAEASATNNYIRRYTGDASETQKTLNAMVNVLECDGGRVELHLSRNLNWDRNPTARDPYSKYSMVGWHEGCAEIRDGWSPSHKRLGVDGNVTKGMIDMDFALCCDPTGLIKYVPTALTA